MTAQRSEPESFTCPRCGAASYHPQDVEHGYCARCHDFTGPVPWRCYCDGDAGHWRGLGCPPR